MLNPHLNTKNQNPNYKFRLVYKLFVLWHFYKLVILCYIQTIWCNLSWNLVHRFFFHGSSTFNETNSISVYTTMTNNICVVFVSNLLKLLALKGKYLYMMNDICIIKFLVIFTFCDFYHINCIYSYMHCFKSSWIHNVFKRYTIYFIR